MSAAVVANYMYMYMRFIYTEIKRNFSHVFDILWYNVRLIVRLLRRPIQWSLLKNFSLRCRHDGRRTIRTVVEAGGRTFAVVRSGAVEYLVVPNVECL